MSEIIPKWTFSSEFEKEGGAVKLAFEHKAWIQIRIPVKWHNERRSSGFHDGDLFFRCHRVTLYRLLSRYASVEKLYVPHQREGPVASHSRCGYISHMSRLQHGVNQQTKPVGQLQPRVVSHWHSKFPLIRPSSRMYIATATLCPVKPAFDPQRLVRQALHDHKSCMIMKIQPHSTNNIKYTNVRPQRVMHFWKRLSISNK